MYYKRTERSPPGSKRFHLAFIIRGRIAMNLVKTLVRKCSASDCSYNEDNMCRALGINIGDEHQKCDTYLEKSKRAGSPGSECVVGSCKVYNCIFNIDYLCASDTIEVGRHKGHYDCMNYCETGL